ncbi:hypothetical protein Leryth_002761 [Lithospermum erythrorhizon]|nr:hypothetical protein Leryth_002761 [Lithospermum erythrorhizon]
MGKAAKRSKKEDFEIDSDGKCFTSRRIQPSINQWVVRMQFNRIWRLFSKSVFSENPDTCLMSIERGHKAICENRSHI